MGDLTVLPVTLPGWTSFVGPRGIPHILARCAWCGRPLNPRGYNVTFYNLAAPVGRQHVVGWHMRCFAKDERGYADTVNEARADADRWRALLETVRARNPNRIGPGDAYPRPSDSNG